MNYKHIGYLLLIISCCCILQACSQSASVAEHPVAEKDAWENVDRIMESIVPPTFPDKDFTITSYGAVGDGNVDCSDAIRKAIEACSADGGGRVVVPAGSSLSGPIYLKSNVNLYLLVRLFSFAIVYLAISLDGAVKGLLLA